MTQDDDIWQFQDDAYLAFDYWRRRCLAAEEFISLIPKTEDIDVTPTENLVPSSNTSRSSKKQELIDLITN